MFSKIKVLMFVALISFPLWAEAQMNQSNTQVELVAVRMYADWCGNCKMLDAKVDNIKKEFQDSNVLFLYFDQTDDYATSQAEKKAYLLGLDEVFAKYKGKTGMMILVDAQTGELIEEISHTVPENELKNKLTQNL